MTATVAGVPVSALTRLVERPRALIVALHGGAADSRYFRSLLEVAPALGHSVIALDRPGYGASAGCAASPVSPADRVDFAYAAVDALAPQHGAGVFVLAHSAGCELAVRMAADPRGSSLLGIELAGTGRLLHPVAAGILDNGAVDRPSGVQRLLWQPRWLYPADEIGGARFASAAPAYEAGVLSDWAPREFARCAADVRVPVHFTLGDHDTVWRGDPEAMADIVALFAAAPRVVTHVQADSGHNLSVGWTATAYHLRVLSFVEECVVAREVSGGRD